MIPIGLPNSHTATCNFTVEDCIKHRMYSWLTWLWQTCWCAELSFLVFWVLWLLVKKRRVVRYLAHSPFYWWLILLYLWPTLLFADIFWSVKAERWAVWSYYIINILHSELVQHTAFWSTDRIYHGYPLDQGLSRSHNHINHRFGIYLDVILNICITWTQ